MIRCFLVILSVLVVSSQWGESQQPKSEKKNSEDFVFYVEPSVIAPGDAAVLHWSVKGATRVVIKEEPDSKHTLYKLGTFGAQGSLEVHPRESTTYVIDCEGTTALCASATVRVRITKR